MYLKYDEPHDLSEDELKEQIVLSIQDIVEKWPEYFECGQQSIPPRETETSLFIERIAKLPPLHQIQAGVLVRENIVGLRMICRFVKAIRWEAEIEIRFLGIISLLFSSQFLGIRYWVATDLIERVLKKKLIYDFDRTLDSLMNPWDGVSAEKRAAFESGAEEEINRVLTNTLTRDRFIDVITRFEESFECQVRTAFPKLFVETSFRIGMEAMIASADIINEALGDTDDLDLKFFGNLIDQLMRQGKRFTNERLGIKRGGPRTTEKFVWNDDRKREFYETVITLVHKNGEPLWEFAYKELVEKDFSYRIIDLLRTETTLGEVPIDIWNKAIKAWRGQVTDFVRLEADKTPKAFGMYHALYLLDYPPTAFSTMKRYFGHGKRLSMANKGS